MADWDGSTRIFAPGAICCIAVQDGLVIDVFWNLRDREESCLLARKSRESCDPEV